MTDHETVLNDLLLLLGVEGVTLWHIRALAELLRVRAESDWRVSRWSAPRMGSDLRGEDAVLDEAWAENAERDAQRRAHPEWFGRNGHGDCEHEFTYTPDGEVCIRCGGIPPRTPGEYELD